jgi:flagellin-like hook-associated protein FlgL
MADINLTAAVRSNLSSLQNTATLMAKTSDRLSTGNKVNSALDNPTNFFTASSLNSRAGDLNNLMDSMSSGIKTIEAANNGLTAITKNLESMQSTLRQARQDKSFQTASYTLAKIDPNAADLGKLTLSGGAVGNPTEIALTKAGTGAQVTMAAKFEAPLAATPASIAGDVVNDGAADAAFTVTFGGKTATISYVADTTTPTLADMEAQIAEQLAASDLSGIVEFSATGGKFTFTTAKDVDGDITIAGANADDVMGTAPADPDDIQAGEYTATTGSDGKYSLTINNKAIEIKSGVSLDEAITSINTQLGDKSKFEAYKDAGGTIALRATSADAGTLTIGGADADLFGTVAATASLTFARSVDEMVSAVNTALDSKVRASNDNGKLRIENLSTDDLTVAGLDANGAIDGTAAEATIKGNAVRAGLADQFNELRDQLDKLSDDASFNGINLLRGDNLKITFNETGTSEIDIRAKGEVAVNSTSLGVSTTLNAKDLDTDSNIDAQLATLKLALNSVRSQASAFGSNLSIVQNRQDFTKSMINTLETGAGNLTLADMNQEAANMMALQTRQSLASSTLSMANQADQGVLQLLR